LGVSVTALVVGPVVSPAAVVPAVTKVSIPPKPGALLLCNRKAGVVDGKLALARHRRIVAMASPVCPGARVSAATLWLSVGSVLASFGHKDLAQAEHRHRVVLDAGIHIAEAALLLPAALGIVVVSG